MKLEERKPMEDMVAIRLKYTHRDPAEWIAHLRNGTVAHIVATPTNLLIATGVTLNDALIAARDGEVRKILHGQGTRAVGTREMIIVTGLNLGTGVEVNERASGDVG